VTTEPFGIRSQQTMVGLVCTYLDLLRAEAIEQVERHLVDRAGRFFWIRATFDEDYGRYVNATALFRTVEQLRDYERTITGPRVDKMIAVEACIRQAKEAPDAAEPAVKLGVVELEKGVAYYRGLVAQRRELIAEIQASGFPILFEALPDSARWPQSFLTVERTRAADQYAGLERSIDRLTEISAMPSEVVEDADGRAIGTRKVPRLAAS
jgi:hypothetical protein